MSNIMFIMNYLSGAWREEEAQEGRRTAALVAHVPSLGKAYFPNTFSRPFSVAWSSGVTLRKAIPE